MGVIVAESTDTIFYTLHLQPNTWYQKLRILNIDMRDKINDDPDIWTILETVGYIYIYAKHNYHVCAQVRNAV